MQGHLRLSIWGTISGKHNPGLISLSIYPINFEFNKSNASLQNYLVNRDLGNETQGQVQQRDGTSDLWAENRKKIKTLNREPSTDSSTVHR